MIVGLLSFLYNNRLFGNRLPIKFFFLLQCGHHIAKHVVSINISMPAIWNSCQGETAYYVAAKKVSRWSGGICQGAWNTCTVCRVGLESLSRVSNWTTSLHLAPLRCWPSVCPMAWLASHLRSRDKGVQSSVDLPWPSFWSRKHGFHFTDDDSRSLKSFSHLPMVIELRGSGRKSPRLHSPKADSFGCTTRPRKGPHKGFATDFWEQIRGRERRCSWHPSAGKSPFFDAKGEELMTISLIRK